MLYQLSYSRSRMDNSPQRIHSLGSRAIERHRRARHRGHVTSDFDALGTIIAVDEDVQEAAPLHLRSLLADEAAAVRARRKSVLHHVGCKRSHGATRGGVLD